MSRKRKKHKPNLPDSRPKDPLATEPHLREGQSEPKSESPHHNPNTPMQGSHPVERSQKVTPKCCPYTSENDRQQKQHINVPDWIIALSTVGILFATFTNVWVANKQWTAMDATLTETRETTKATKLSADAAAASTIPWLVTDNWEYKGFEKDHPNVMLFHIGMKNVGKTSAIETEVGHDFIFIEGPNLNAVPPYEPYTCPKPDAKPGLVYPDVRMENTVRYGPLTVDQLRALREKKARVLIHGCIKYRDVLSENERITEYGTLYMGTDEPVPFRIVHQYMRMK